MLGLAFSIYPMAFGCDVCAVAGVAAGAGVGWALDTGVRGRHVYGKPPRVFWRRPAPVSALSDLWSRVRPGEEITVQDLAEGERRGGICQGFAGGGHDQD